MRRLTKQNTIFAKNHIQLSDIMKKLLLLTVLLWAGIAAQAQFITTYYQVYRVQDLSDRVIDNSPFEGAPVMLQTGGDRFTGFMAYLNMASLGNIQYSMTMDMTVDGYYIYAMPAIGGGYSLTDLLGNPHCLMVSPRGDDIAFVTKDGQFRASPISRAEYMRLTQKLVGENLDFYRSISPGSSSGSGSSGRSSGGGTCTTATAAASAPRAPGQATSTTPLRETTSSAPAASATTTASASSATDGEAGRGKSTASASTCNHSCQMHDRG